MEWRDIENFSGYQVSDTGLVRSLDREVVDSGGFIHHLKGKLLKPSHDTHGYLQYVVSKSGKRSTHPAHRLVARVFIGPCPEGQEICHGVRGKLDNSVENLSYATHIVNQSHRYRDGTMDCTPVRRGDGVVFSSMQEAAKESKVNQGSVSRVCRKLRKKIGGYTFEFI